MCPSQRGKKCVARHVVPIECGGVAPARSTRQRGERFITRSHSTPGLPTATNATMSRRLPAHLLRCRRDFSTEPKRLDGGTVGRANPSGVAFASRTVVIAGHGLAIAPNLFSRAADRRENPRRRARARRREGDPRRRSRRGRGLVDPHGRLWRAGAAVADHRPMPQWRARLARGRMQSLQDPREPAARRDPPAARHADLEA